MNKTVPLAAVGLGNLFINMLGVAIFFGLNGALETLVSQAYGANDKHLCGIYLQRGRFINTIMFLFVMIPLVFSGKILAGFGQDQQVAEQAGKYVLAYTPGIYFLSMLDIQRRFLIQMGHSSLPMNVALFGTILHLGWNYLFVIHLDFGVIGAGLAASITNFIILMGNIIATRFLKDLSEATSVSFFERSVFRNTGEYLKIGVPGSVIMLFDWGCYQILSVLSGYIGVKEQAAQIILWNIMTIMWQIPFGF